MLISARRALRENTKSAASKNSRQVSENFQFNDDKLLVYADFLMKLNLFRLQVTYVT